MRRFPSHPAIGQTVAEVLQTPWEISGHGMNRIRACAVFVRTVQGRLYQLGLELLDLTDSPPATPLVPAEYAGRDPQHYQPQDGAKITAVVDCGEAASVSVTLENGDVLMVDVVGSVVGLTVEKNQTATS